MKLLLLTFLTINNNYSDYLYTVMYNVDPEERSLTQS